jgi:hypothetical protein
MMILPCFLHPNEIFLSPMHSNSRVQSRRSPILLNRVLPRKRQGNKHNRALARFPLPRRSPHGKGAAPKRSPSLGQCLSCLLQFIGWRCVGVWLQPVKIIGGLLRVAGGGEDRPLVVTCRFEDWEVHKRDMIDIGRGDFTT